MTLKDILKKTVRTNGLFLILVAGVLLFGCSDGGSHPSSEDSGSIIADGGTTPGQEEPLPEIYLVTTPVRISEFDAETLLVSDAGTQKIVFVDKSTLEPTGGFKVAGKPSGVIFADDHFFVGNSTNGSVEIFNTNGKLVSRLGERGQFGLVNDLAINRDLGLLYVLDTRGQQVHVYNLDGSAAGILGAGLLTRPTALTVDDSGRIIVSDYGDPEPSGGWSPTAEVYLRIFNSSGNFSHDVVVGTTFDTTPQGLYPGAGGHVYMANARLGEIKVFNVDTETLVTTLGTLGVGPGELFYPLDVFVDDATNDVYVTDFRNQRIAAFPGGGELP